MAESKEILTFAVELGDYLLRNGAEVYRVEDCVLAILKAYEINDCDVYVLTNGIFASANETTVESSSIIRHVPLQTMHLNRFAALNRLCRDVCDKNITIDEAWKKLDEYKDLPSYSNKALILASGLGCGCFSYLFGGTITDAIIAFCIGLFLQEFLNLFKKYSSSNAVANVLGSSLVTIFAFILLALGLPIHYDKVIIGDIMPLVPGIALTNSIRDFINGDYLSGAIRLIDALLTAFCIATGVGIVITITHIFWGGMLGL